MATNIKYTHNPIVRMDENEELTVDKISTLIRNSEYQQLTRYEKLEDYYQGNHDILDRYYEDTSKPNNRIVNNFASYITDINVGYFSGIPCTYMTEDIPYYEALMSVMQNNDEFDENTELDKQCNIKGHSFELLWIDENADLRYKKINPEQVVMIYSSDIDEKPLYAIRWFNEYDFETGQVSERKIFVYDKTFVTEYYQSVQDIYSGSLNAKSEMFIKDRYPHLFDELPIIEYLNNGERTGTFEDVVSLIDAYNILTSDSINDVEYFTDAYLVIKNLSATSDDDLSDMKNNRVMKIDGDGSAEWLTKTINDNYLQNIKDRIESDIHKFSKTPNLVSDEFVSNLSGTAIKYKVWGLEQIASNKERKWLKSLRKRLRLITAYLNIKGGNFDHTSVKIVFNRNLPQNVIELSQMVSQLRGSISTETLLAQVPFVDNTDLEIKRLKAERIELQDEEIEKEKKLKELEPKPVVQEVVEEPKSTAENADNIDDTEK